MRVESVRIMETNYRYQKVIDALYFLDSITNDGFFKQTIDVPMVLIRKLLDLDSLSASFDPYIVSMVKSHVRRKQKIIINLEGLKEIKEQVSELVVTNKIEEVNTMDSDWDPASTFSSGMNMISSNFLCIYPNIKSIIIKTGEDDESFPFDMMTFLENIKSSTSCNFIKVLHLMYTKRNENKSWTVKLWNASKSTLIEAYKQQNFEILFEKSVVDFDTHDEYYSHEYFNIARV